MIGWARCWRCSRVARGERKRPRDGERALAITPVLDRLTYADAKVIRSIQEE